MISSRTIIHLLETGFEPAQTPFRLQRSMFSDFQSHRVYHFRHSSMIKKSHLGQYEGESLAGVPLHTACSWAARSACHSSHNSLVYCYQCDDGNFSLNAVCGADGAGATLISSSSLDSGVSSWPLS